MERPLQVSATYVDGVRKRAADKPAWLEVLRSTLKLFVPLALVAAGVMYLLFHVQTLVIHSEVNADLEKTVEIARQRVDAEFASVVSDVRYLAGQRLLQHWLAAGDPAARADLGRDYLVFSAEKAVYDQVRLIDMAGQEVVRVNWNEGRPELVPEQPLQDKAERYYIRETRNLDKGQIYVSPFDLNVEHGAVEHPVKPMIRFGTPVFGPDGRKHGMVILNYRGQRVLDHIKALAAVGPGQIWLLNSDGYWLLGPTSQDEWAFMYPDRKERSFARDYPEAWDRIRNSSGSGQVLEAGDLFTFARTGPVGRSEGINTGPGVTSDSASLRRWHVVSHLPAAELGRRSSELTRNVILASAVLALLLAGVAYTIARLGLRRRKAEEDMRTSEARFRAVSDTASDGVVVADETGLITYFNTAAERIFGYSASEILRQPLTLLMPEHYREAHSQGLERLQAGGEPKVIGKSLELMGRRKSGEEFPVELSLASARIDQGIFFTGILRDITQRKRDEQAIRDSEARFRALLESAPDAVVISDPGGRIVLVNAQAERLFGYRRDELIGESVDLLVPERFRAGHTEHRKGYLRAPRARPMGAGLELRGLRADGTELPIEISLSPVDADEGLLIVSDIRDVTEQRAAQREISSLNERLARDNAELESLNREMESFSYSVSHDLRAPLRAIDGFSQALLEDCSEWLDEAGRGYLDRVRNAAQRMGLLIDDLLKLSRVTRADMNIGDVDLSGLAGEIAAELRLAEPERRVEFAIAERVVARGDARLLRIVLENLLGNAWKFTAGGDPARIELGCDRIERQPAFFVRDNGVGFDMAYRDQLFRAFQRLHDTRVFPGTGIGLATVQRIVHKHGGRVWAEAEPGSGATFYFTLE